MGQLKSIGIPNGKKLFTGQGSLRGCPRPKLRVCRDKDQNRDSHMGNGRTDPGIWPDASPASVSFPGSGHADAMPPGKSKTWILMHAGPSPFHFLYNLISNKYYLN